VRAFLSTTGGEKEGRRRGGSNKAQATQRPTDGDTAASVPMKVRFTPPGQMPAPGTVPCPLVAGTSTIVQDPPGLHAAERAVKNPGTTGGSGFPPMAMDALLAQQLQQRLPNSPNYLGLPTGSSGLCADHQPKTLTQEALKDALTAELIANLVANKGGLSRILPRTRLEGGFQDTGMQVLGALSSLSMQIGNLERRLEVLNASNAGRQMEAQGVNPSVRASLMELSAALVLAQQGRLPQVPPVAPRAQ